ncbi:MAG: hypothetical protein LBV72_10195 [Tannerella sp.]|jgi:hypothetical protein|nr:hypothetical protein [Tannerella sp.]
MITKQEKDKKTYDRFNALVASGFTKGQATHKVMKDFKILSPMTIYNIRKRCEKSETVES